MVYVVSKNSKMVHFKIDAWESNCIEKACQWAVNHGWSIVEDEITEMGSMILWVI